MSTKKKILFSVLSAALLAGVFVGGTYYGYSRRPYHERVTGVENIATPEDVSADFNAFWKVWRTIDEKYPDAKGISAQDRVYGAIKGLVGSLGDPYSTYFTPVESKEFQESINGSFDGIGMEIGIKDNAITVVAPIKSTPAERAGLKPGDVILKIDDKTTNEMSLDEAIHLIRGKKGTSVKLSVYTKGADAPRDVTVVRDTIDIPLIDSKDLGGGVFKISLYNFGATSAPKFADAIDQFRKSGSDKLIIDLRSNPGGYLDAAVDIGSMFLPRGATIVRESYGDGQEDDVYRSKGYGFVDPKVVKIAVLVDGGSASASEILAGALKENGVAVLIGEKTYGKGSVQELLDVSDDTTLKLTVAKWLTPKGVWISKKGIEPDIPVAVKIEDLKAGKDPVQQRALEYLKNE